VVWKRRVRAMVALLLWGLAGLAMMVAAVSVLALAVRLPWPLFDSSTQFFSNMPSKSLVLLFLAECGLVWGCQVLVRRGLGIESIRQIFGDVRK